MNQKYKYHLSNILTYCFILHHPLYSGFASIFFLLGVSGGEWPYLFLHFHLFDNDLDISSWEDYFTWESLVISMFERYIYPWKMRKERKNEKKKKQKMKRNKILHMYMIFTVEAVFRHLWEFLYEFYSSMSHCMWVL